MFDFDVLEFGSAEVFGWEEDPFGFADPPAAEPRVEGKELASLLFAVGWDREAVRLHGSDVDSSFC